MRPNLVQSRFTRASGSQATGNMTRLQFLLFGVRDNDRGTLAAAAAGTVKLSREEVDDILGRINSPIRHRDVIEKALADGLPVPVVVLADYPDLRQWEP